MKALPSLNRLLTLREQEVDRLHGEVAAKEALHRRYHNALERLDTLYAGSGASGSLPPALALNCGAYKQNVLQLAATHRDTMAQHEADIAVTRHALREAAQRHQALSQISEKQQAILRLSATRREQKRQDDLATQVWLRRNGQ